MFPLMLGRKTIPYYPQACIIKSRLLLEAKNNRSLSDTESSKQYMQLLFFPIHFYKVISYPDYFASSFAELQWKFLKYLEFFSLNNQI